MHKIIKLSDEIINEIAAGEVIDRPSSVIKELLENAVDAEAKNIVITTHQGGKTKISVNDDGFGIDEKYIKLSVKRHATSKLYAKDISNIKSLGFRGEALYSIASASKLTIISKTLTMNHARSLVVNKNIILEIKPAKGNVGTTVIVKNLFQNMPVRKKFLKSDRAESLSTKETIKKIAIANPNIVFKFYENDKLKLNYLCPKRYENNLDSLKQRISDVIGDDFIAASQLMDTSSRGFSVRGYFSIPTYNKPNWNDSILVINKRVVKDRLLLGAIKAGYSGVLAGGRFPVVALFIETDPGGLDINVHPTKSQVRILERAYLNSLIINQIRNSLENIGLRKSIIYEKELLKKIKKQDSSNFETKEINFEFNSTLVEVDNRFIKENNNFYNVKDRLGYAVAQVNRMFIISQAKEKLILVDQHAAHERIVLENLKKNFENNKVVRQTLLIPKIIKLEKSKRIILENKNEIEKIGFIIEDYGENDVLVREIPSILGKINIQALFEDIVEKIKIMGKIEKNNPKIIELFSSIACHNSIRAGRKLNIEEMNSLLRLMEKTPNAGQCNHGRPTFIELKLSDIEKMFGRT